MLHHARRAMSFSRELVTERLILRAPRDDDAEAIFARYASDAEVTRMLGWPRHRTIDDTREFLAFAARQWDERAGFVYLVTAREDGRLLGSTGLALEDRHMAMTGYVLAKDAWGHGFATEALRAMVALARGAPEIWRLYAYCHVANAASERVLGKGGFVREGTLRRHTVFPNFESPDPQDVAIWARIKGDEEAAPTLPEERIARAVAARHGVPNVVDVLGERLAGSELTSLLLAVFRRRAARGASTFTHAASEYRRAPALSPSRASARSLHAIDDAAFTAARDFDAIALSPVQPLGLNAATGIDQNNVASVIRGWEVLADPTSQLALEAAERRRRDRAQVARLCAAARAMRLQPTNVKGYAPHFHLFAMVSAGRAEGEEAFEQRELGRHARVYVHMLRALGLRVARVELSDTRATSALLAAAGLTHDDVRRSVRGHAPTSGPELLARHGVTIPRLDDDIAARLSELPLRDDEKRRIFAMHANAAAPLSAELALPVRIDLGRLHALDYYDGWRLSVVIADEAGEAAVGDGGVVTWTQTILGDRKERLVTSGIGSEYLAVRFLPASQDRV
jgi:ribosomal-protein-alanine N-acetyltransferase